MRPSTTEESKPQSPHEDFIAQVKLALDRVSDPRPLATILTKLGLSVRYEPHMVVSGPLSIDRGWGYWRLAKGDKHMGTGNETIARQLAAQLSSQPPAVKPSPVPTVLMVLTSHIKDILATTSAPAVVAGLGQLGIDAHLCGHGVSVQRHGYLYQGDGAWNLLWPICDPITEAGAVAARIARLQQVTEVAHG